MESTPKDQEAVPQANGTEKPKRERRPRKPKADKAAQEGETPKGDAPADEQKPKREKAPKKDKDGPKEQGNAPQYRKKGEKPEGEQKPKKSKSPEAKPTADGEEKPKEKKKRPQTSKADKMQYRPKGEKGDAKPEDESTPTPDGEQVEKKEEKKKEAPKNLVYQNPMDFKEKRKFKTKWEEYRHGDWRKGSGKTFVTLETVIPPKPETLLKPPEEKTFHTKQSEIEARIKEINSALDEKKTSFEEILAQKQAQMKAGDTGVVFSKELSQKFVRMGELKKQRSAIYDAQEKVEGNKAELIAIKESMNSRIDKFFNKEEMIPKAIREAEKAFQTSSGNYKKEQEFMRRVEFLKNSVPCIKKRSDADDKLRAMLAAKKEVAVDLPKIRGEMKKLQDEIDVLKKSQDVKTETKETFDKQLDQINERRKKHRDERDKLYKQKEELRDGYYGALIEYSKQQYLLQDIDWMTQMQSNLQKRKEEKDRRDREYKERKERIQKEREEKKQREEERKQREIARKEKEVENKRLMEESLKSDEIDRLKKIDEAIEDNAIATNPMFEQIDQCDNLKKFCLKQLQKGDDPKGVEEETKEEIENKIKGELEKALKKGSIQMVETKKETVMQIGSKGKKAGGKRKNNQGESGAIDFSTIKKFNNLKITAPINEGDFEKVVKDLDELRDALIYWGKIIQRQNKIKFIRNARKISSIEEYTQQAEAEEKFIENEKSKFDGENVSDKTTLSLDKLKIAQVIDRENRVKRVWNDEEDEEDSEESTEETRARRKGEIVETRQAKRPNAQKFKDIMKGDDAFPTLENQYDDDDDDLLDGETPAGEINSQNE